MCVNSLCAHQSEIGDERRLPASRRRHQGGALERPECSRQADVSALSERGHDEAGATSAVLKVVREDGVHLRETTFAELEAGRHLEGASHQDVVCNGV